MSVYLDNARIPAKVAGIVARWSHLTADARAELDAFAARLGLRAQWIQHPGSCLEHYDLTDSKRRLALRLGAIAITSGEAGHQVVAKRQGYRFDLAALRKSVDAR